MQHRLSQVNEELRTANCLACGEVKICVKEIYPSGKIKWMCQRKSAARQAKQVRPYRIHLKATCERCGFIPEAIKQLDIHHLDGNHYNNELTNLQTLCANCHRVVH